MPTLAPHSGSGSFPSPAGFPAFFRDEGELKALKTLMRRRLDAPAGAPLRVWVPECSTGEDAYTVAMSLLEAAGRRWREMPLAVLSTGSDRDALALARAGRYSAAHPGLSDARRRRFFETRDGALRARPFLRASCLFVPRHPSEGPPGGRFDLIASRDVLRGFAPERRHPLLAEYHAALAPRGLLLDRSGCAADVPGLFAPVGRGRSYAAVARPRAAPPPSGEGEERFRVLFSQSAEAILVRDAATDRVLEANVAAQALLGYGLPELIQMTGEELTVPPGVVRRALNERRGEARLRMPHYRRADGTVFSADVRTSFLMSGGRPCRLDMIRDASERLRAAGAEGRDARRDAFVGEVIHELRTPITVIRGSAESLRARPTPKDRAEFLGFIEAQSMRMAGLVDRLLDLSAADAPTRAAKPADVPLAAALWDVVAGFQPVAKRAGLRISVDVPAGLSVRADPADLPHLFGNLIDNALKFSPRGGEIRVECRVEGRMAAVTVRDAGPGIPPAETEKIFERFHRTELTRKVKGTGLGLAIVRALAAANGGAVGAGNHPDGGAVLRVSLPLATEARC